MINNDKSASNSVLVCDKYPITHFYRGNKNLIEALGTRNFA